MVVSHCHAYVTYLTYLPQPRVPDNRATWHHHSTRCPTMTTAATTTVYTFRTYTFLGVSVSPPLPDPNSRLRPHLPLRRISPSRSCHHPTKKLEPFHGLRAKFQSTPSPQTHVHTNPSRTRSSGRYGYIHRYGTPFLPALRRCIIFPKRGGVSQPASGQTLPSGFEGPGGFHLSGTRADQCPTTRATGGHGRRDNCLSELELGTS